MLRDVVAATCALGVCAAGRSTSAGDGPKASDQLAAGSGGPNDIVPVNAGTGVVAASHGTEAIPAVPTVRFVYLKPSDRALCFDSIERGARPLTDRRPLRSR